LQYKLSRKEREKRDVREAMISEEQWEYLSQYYNKEMVMNLTGLDEQEADSFMIYFNSKSVLRPNSTEYEVRAAILHEFENYKKEKEKVEAETEDRKQPELREERSEKRGRKR
jgi:endonuclease III-like uncharacterized protein